MSRRDNAVTTYLSDEEKRELSEFVSECDDSQATVVRNALLEYLDFDRYDRVESQVRENSDKLDRVLTLLADDEHTHTSAPSKASSTVEKARTIARRLHKNHDPPVKTVAIERAIEDIAGADDRTIEKYTELLKKRGLMYEHPSESPVWTDDRSEWVGWVESYVDATPSAEVLDYLDRYDMDQTEYNRLADTIKA